jgi:2-deoxy-D-gluconate 3-dehydrogenase
MVSKPYSLDFRIDGKIAVITGAGSGIGRATAELFVEKGAFVCLLDCNKKSIEKISDEMHNASSYFVDVTDYSSICQVVESIIEEKGRIDILINSAGIGTIGWAQSFSENDWRRVLDINLTGTFLMSQRIGQEMIKAKNGGKIVCVASQAGIVAIDQHVAYSASKAGIISMVKSLAYEWGKYDIQVNAVSPTATETPIIVGYWDVGEVHDKAIANTPAGRFCKPAEIAAAVMFLSCGASNMITGSNLVVDGGYTIH